MSPTYAQLGTYSVRITYYSPVNSATIQQTFLVDVYPNVDLSFEVPTQSCVADIYPATLGNYADIFVVDGDYDGTNFIVCGSTKNLLNTNETYYSAFMQSYNSNFMVNY